MQPFNYLDLTLGLIVVFSALIGLARGLVKEVLSLIAWAVAIYVAWRFADMIANDYVRQVIDDKLISYLAAFGLLFLVTLFVVGLFNLVISQLLTSTGLSGFDRFLGMLFGLARGIIIGALVVFVIKLMPLDDAQWWQRSRLAPGFVSLGDWGWAKLPADIRQLLRDSGETVSQAGRQFAHDEFNPSAIDGALANRPDHSTDGVQRNAISALSDAEIQLESLSAEQTHQQRQTVEEQPQSIDRQSELNQAVPTLQLESVQ